MNPLLQPFDTPFGSYPFDKISIADFKEAFAHALAEKRAEADTIINSTEPPTFANTILALELCGEKLELVCGAFFNLLHADSNDELMNLSQEIMPELTRLSTDIALSQPLFVRIRTYGRAMRKKSSRMKKNAFCIIAIGALSIAEHYSPQRKKTGCVPCPKR